MSMDKSVRHQNQFLLCDPLFQPTVPEGFSHADISGDFDIYYSDALPFHHASDGDTELAIIGDVVVPNGPTIEQWLKETVTVGVTGVLRRAQALTGRYAIIRTTEDSTTVVPDAVANKSLYYHADSRLVTSSLKLLVDSVDVDLTENTAVTSFMNTPQFKGNESALIGDKTLFQEVRCVLPNHVLDADGMEVSRRPLFFPTVERPPAEYIADRITSAMESFNEDYHLLTPITAGRDTRMILACSRDIVRDVTWYTFSDWGNGEHPDVKIPKRIAAEQDFDYTIHHPRSLDDDFRAAFEEYLCWTRVLPKTRHVQFFSNNYDVNDVLYVSGNGPIYKVNYEMPERGTDLVDHFCTELQYPDSEFVRNEIEEWLPGAVEYAKEYDISPANLLYWEQRMGRWGALAPRETDFAIRGVSPLVNYDLLLTGLHVERSRVSPPEYDLIDSVIETEWPELLKYTYNPSENPYKATIGRVAPPRVKRALTTINAKLDDFL
ncbi:hypothetical protein [Haladaptatus sp. DYF46]|uniref:hypothetical protein n=1 Tax=Haladaptatus sp. DYF46 TaxID=2886041 RepID=UPI001E603D2C|nr:hypothetical protein [Haladaptatus sp. DYF46]